jgi:hypothetical protein
MKDLHIEIIVPLVYSVKRECLRFGLSCKASAFRVVSAALKSSLWIPIYILLASIENVDFQTMTYLMAAVISYIIVYEAGYLYTDNISILGETSSIKNAVYTEPVGLSTVYLGIVIRVIVSLGLLGLVDSVVVKAMWPYFAATLFIFYVHGKIGERYRVATFLMLRVVKAVAPYAVLYPLVNQMTPVIFVVAVVGLNLFDVLEYGARKSSLQSSEEIDFFDITYGLLSLATSVVLVLVALLAAQKAMVDYLLLLCCMAVYTSLVNLMLHLRRNRT